MPAIAAWRARRARVAIFGTGPHTELLLEAVPELIGSLVGFLQSEPPAVDALYRGLPLRDLNWADRHTDIVVCSSFTREVEQLELLRARVPKAVLSHPVMMPSVPIPVRAPTAPDLSQFLMVPTYGYPIRVDA